MQWHTPPRQIALDPGEVHVWLALRGDVISTNIVASGLANDEIAAAQRLRRPADRELYLLAHVMLRDVLAR